MDNTDYIVGRIYDEIEALRKQARIDLRSGSDDYIYGRLSALEECLEIVEGFKR